jgi:hypothetical protein
VLIWKFIIHWWVLSVIKYIYDKFYEEIFLLYFWSYQLKIELLKKHDPLGEINCDKSSTEKVLHGVGICNEFGGSMKNVMI